MLSSRCWATPITWLPSPGRGCVGPASPKKENQKDVIDKEIYSRELVRVTVESPQSRTVRAGRLARDPGRSQSHDSSPDTVPSTILSCLAEVGLFVPLEPSADSMRPYHDWAICFTQSPLI